tara:strand:- start:120 stop:773 length:654 start_codon:yes stop_codon:yes gene_type:complete
MKNIFIALVCLFVSFQISAQVRQKDSHEHGAANLMLVIEGDKLQIGIEVPSDSLIGFEYFPKSQSDRRSFNEAIKILSDPSKIFSTPDDAECILTGLNVSQTLFSGESEDGHGDHDVHGHEEKGFWDSLFGHDDHDEHGHEDHDEHGHEDSEKGEIHSEYRSNYSWNCLHTDDLDSIGNNLFSFFPRIEEIRVKWITSSGQGSLELESGDNRIRGWK